MPHREEIMKQAQQLKGRPKSSSFDGKRWLVLFISLGPLEISEGLPFNFPLSFPCFIR
jgi:hypothetical protein